MYSYIKIMLPVCLVPSYLPPIPFFSCTVVWHSPPLSSHLKKKKSNLILFEKSLDTPAIQEAQTALRDYRTCHQSRGGLGLSLVRLVWNRLVIEIEGSCSWSRFDSKREFIGEQRH